MPKRDILDSWHFYIKKSKNSNSFVIIEIGDCLYFSLHFEQYLYKLCKVRITQISLQSDKPTVKGN